MIIKSKAWAIVLFCLSNCMTGQQFTKESPSVEGKWQISADKGSGAENIILVFAPDGSVKDPGNKFCNLLSKIFPTSPMSQGETPKTCFMTWIRQENSNKFIWHPDSSEMDFILVRSQKDGFSKFQMIRPKPPGMFGQVSMPTILEFPVELLH